MEVTENPSGRAGEQSRAGVVEVVVDEGGVVATISGSGSWARVGSGVSVQVGEVNPEVVVESTWAAVEDDPGEVAVVGFSWFDSPVEQVAKSSDMTTMTATGRNDPEVVVGVGLEYLFKRAPGGLRRAVAQLG